MKIARRTLAACTLTLAVLSAAPATGALASITSSHPAASHVSAAAVARGTADVIRPDGNPTGCPTGDMCIYRNPGGSNLCLASPGNETNLGACANEDGAVFNNGFVGNPNGVVAMNHLQNYYGAWTCIATGNYWLFTSSYYFNGGPGTTGYGATIYNAVASFHWQENNCGSSMSP